MTIGFQENTWIVELLTMELYSSRGAPLVEGSHDGRGSLWFLMVWAFAYVVLVSAF